MRSTQLPSMVTVATFHRYEDAQGAVDLLAEREFPVQHLSIVGTNLRQVEHVVGTMSYAKVAGAGALQGFFYGVLLSFLMVAFTGDALVSSLLTAVPLGVAFWMIMNVVMFSRQGGAGKVSTVGQLVAGTYELVCPPQEAGQARQLLSGEPAGGSSPMNLRPMPDEQPAPRDPWRFPGQQGPNPGGGHGPDDQQQQIGQQDQYGQPGRYGQQAPSRPQPQQAPDYQDLPDGRPRYGLRAEDVEQTHGAESHHDAGRPGVGDHGTADPRTADPRHEDRGNR